MYLVPVASKAAVITHVVPAITYTGEYPTEPLTDDTAAPFNVNLTVHTWAMEATTATLTATGEWDAAHPVSGPVAIPAGEAIVSVKLTAHGVKLWWPNGFGDQPLYNITASLAFNTDPSFSASPATGAPQVASTRRVGFRYAVLVTGNDTDPAYVKAAATQEGSAPSGGMTTFIFRVNGIFLPLTLSMSHFLCVVSFLSLNHMPFSSTLHIQRTRLVSSEQ